MDVSAISTVVADLHVRIQILRLRDSLFVWAQASQSSSAPSTLPVLSLSHPALQGTAPVANILQGSASTLSNQVALKLATRCGKPVFASVDLGGANGVENAVVARILQEIG